MKMRHRVPLIVLVCATVLSSHPALAQFSQQGPKLVGTNVVGDARQGLSVSVSADGNTAIVGGFYDNNYAGAAWVWTRSGGVWTQQGTKLVGSGAAGTDALQGAGVSVSADGNTAIVGGVGDNSNTGAAWVWTRSGGVWTQQGTKLVGSGAVGTALQGTGVSVSADGNTAIVGGPNDNDQAGAAWVWTRSGGVWTQQGTKLVGSGAVGNAYQGLSVSLSADGNTAIVGGHTDNGTAGAAWVWARSGGIWTQQGTKLVGSGAVGNALQGRSVSLSGDGNTAIVGGLGDNSNTGAAWVWTRSGGVWIQQGTKLVGSGAVGTAAQGESVSLSADGNTAIIGGSGDNNGAGAAWVWKRSGGVWTQQGTKLVGTGAVGVFSAHQGSSVSLSADGNTAIIGGVNDNNLAGAAWVFAASAPAIPAITAPPQGQTAQAGNNVTFTVTASGTAPLNYQWRFNGQNISGATSSTLTLNSVTAANSGGYSVRVSNAYGSVVSATAFLAVLTEGANGNQPAQISVLPAPSKPVAVDSLVVVTHGWLPKPRNFIPGQPPPVLPEWVTDMVEAINNSVPSNWRVVPADWALEAWTILPDSALGNGKIKGALFGQQIAAQSWQHVHLIGHSAGSAFIEAAAEKIKQLSPSTDIQATFLDPYLSFSRSEAENYGASADWADCYFAQDLTGGNTEGSLDNAYAVDVTWVDPNKQVSPIYCPSSTPLLPHQVCGQLATSSHPYPHDFYFASISAANPACASGYGFAMSKEGGGWNNRGNFPVGNQPLVLCGPAPLTQNPFPFNLNGSLQINALSYGTSADGVSFSGAGFSLTTHSPTWLAVGVTISNAVNFVQFDAGFTSTNAADGLLTVYWNTNQIGMADERVSSTNLQSYRFALPGALTNGLYTLSFRLDPMTNVTSSVTITNVKTGFSGVEQPIRLDMFLAASNNTPLLMLSGASNYNYLVESSTNLIDWTTTALLVNTNGAVFFADPAVTNFSRRFYRAVLP